MGSGSIHIAAPQLAAAAVGRNQVVLAAGLIRELLVRGPQGLD